MYFINHVKYYIQLEIRTVYYLFRTIVSFKFFLNDTTASFRNFAWHWYALLTTLISVWMEHKSVFENPFLPSTRPTLREICIKFRLHSPLYYTLHSERISYKLRYTSDRKYFKTRSSILNKFFVIFYHLLSK